MVDETIIDYELVEAVIDLIDAQHGQGAILVFLPGTAPLPMHLLVLPAPNIIAFGSSPVSRDLQGPGLSICSSFIVRMVVPFKL